jgi:lipopolysaccharide export system protein LptC
MPLNLIQIFSVRSQLKLAVAGSAALLLFAGAVAGQILPDAPVRNFRLPMFGEDGLRIWDLRGREGRYISENRVDVSDMRLLIFSSENRNEVETEIRSPQATMHIRSNQAQGDQTITVMGDNFEITGQRWSWDGNANRVVIDERVKVTFFEELSGILQ